MGDSGSRDRQPALCPFPGVDDGRPGWWSRCHTTLRCPGTSAFSPGALPCPLSRPQTERPDDVDLRYGHTTDLANEIFYFKMEVLQRGRGFREQQHH